MNASAERLWRRAQRYLADNQATAARIALESLLVREPAFTQAHLLLGGIAWKEDRVRDATRHALNAARTLPENAELICDIVAALLQVGEVVKARSCMNRPLLAETASGHVMMRLSGQYQILGEHSCALAMLDRARAAGVAGADFHGYRGVQLAFHGRLQEAEAELILCLRLNPAAGRTALMLARSRRQTEASNHLPLLGDGLRMVATGTEDHAALEFARYKELEDLGRYAEAWDALSHANAIMRARSPYDGKHEADAVERLIQLCTPQFLHADFVHEGPQPIFVVGLPRSGTTLIERILGNHSQVASAGELADFSKQLAWVADHRSTAVPDAGMLERMPNLDYVEIGRRYLAQTQWRARGKRYYVDKLPANWLLAGLLRKALPQARILHMIRDPMDVCFSNYRAMFGDSYVYSYALGTLGAHYRVYQRAMAYWRNALPNHLLDVAYTDLVRDPQRITRQVLAFCGLDHEQDIADPTRNSGAVATLSMAQIREPVHRRSFEEWRRYEKQLAPLLAAVKHTEVQ